MVTREGRVVVMDFGLARDSLEPGQGLVGTRHYQAPELFSGSQPSEASDWYAIGAILFRLLTGKRVPAESRRLEDDVATTLQDLAIPADLKHLCIRLLSTDPTRFGFEIGILCPCPPVCDLTCLATSRMCPPWEFRA
jgi:serine/threonine protein kinase